MNNIKQIEKDLDSKKSIYNDPKYGINFLGGKSAIDDIKNLPKYFKILLIIGVFVIVFFNFFSIETIDPSTLKNIQNIPESLQNKIGTHFAPLKQYIIALSNGSPIGAPSKKLALATAILYSLNGVAAFTGLLSISMIVNNKKSQFLWGLINGIFYGSFSLVAGYTGDFLMNLIFILFAPVGWWLFTFKHKGLNSLFDKKWWIKVLAILGAIVAMAGACVAWYYLIPAFHNFFFSTAKYNDSHPREIQHLFDATAQGINTIGYALQLLNFSEQFWIWEFMNIWKLLMFTPIVLGDGVYVITIILQMSVWFVLSGIGLYNLQIKEIIIRTKIQINLFKEGK